MGHVREFAPDRTLLFEGEYDNDVRHGQGRLLLEVEALFATEYYWASYTPIQIRAAACCAVDGLRASLTAAATPSFILTVPVAFVACGATAI